GLRRVCAIDGRRRATRRVRTRARRGAASGDGRSRPVRGRRRHRPRHLAPGRQPNQPPSRSGRFIDIAPRTELDESRRTPMGIGIQSVAYFVPEQVRTNDYWHDNYPELVEKAEHQSLAQVWKKREAATPNIFD